ncbi:MAG: hypothetical protein KJ066_14600, partial [Acidobacteria bacterium]|nr:hypothetical protein [Acidobacteriota bacterium]
MEPLCSSEKGDTHHFQSTAARHAVCRPTVDQRFAPFTRPQRRIFKHPQYRGCLGLSAVEGSP